MASVSVTQHIGEAIRDRALAVDGVAGLSIGRFGEALLRVPGGMIEGVRVTPHDSEAPQVSVYIVYELASKRPIPEVVADVQAAILDNREITEATGIDRVDVVVADAS